MSLTVSKRCWMIILSMVLVLAVTPLLIACGGGDDNSAAESGAASGKTQEKEFRFGYVGAVFGSPDDMDHSIEMAIDEINEAGGVQAGNTTYKFKFCFADDKQTASGAIAAIRKLLYEDKVDAISMNNIAGGLVMLPYINEAKTVTFSWDPPDVWLGPENPYTFYLHTDMSLNDLIVLDWVRQNRPDLKKIEIIQLDMARFHNAAQIHKQIFEEWGLDVHYTWYDFSLKDYYPVLGAVLPKDKSKHPDAILVNQSGGYAVMQQATELGFEGQFVLEESVANFWYDVMSAKELEGLISMSPALDSPDVPQAYKDYLARYEAREGRYPYANGTFTDYMVVYAMAAALKASGSPDSDKLKEVLETQPLTLEFPGGVTMDIQFFGEKYYGVDHNWQPVQYISIHSNGKPQIIKVISLEDQRKYLDLMEEYKGTAGEFVPDETQKPVNTTAPTRKYSINSTCAALLDNPETRAILERHIPKNVIILEDPKQSPEALLSFSLKAFFSLAGDKIDQSKLPLIDADLNALYGE